MIRTCYYLLLHIPLPRFALSLTRSLLLNTFYYYLPLKNSFFQIFFPFYLPNYLRVSIVELQSHYTLHPVQLATHAFGIEYASMPWNLMDLNHE